MLVSCFRSSFKKSNQCQPLEANSNPPLSPFFKGGIFSVSFKPLFGKEGKGRFFAEAGRNYVAKFRVTTLDKSITCTLLLALVVFLVAAASAFGAQQAPKTSKPKAPAKKPEPVIEAVIEPKAVDILKAASSRLAAARKASTA